MTDADELSVIQWNDSNKLLAMYRAGIDNPDQKSRDKKYTNAELALRIDLGKKRLVFTGNFWQDLKYMLWNNHAVLSLFRANYLDPFTRKGRFIVLLVTLAITGISSVAMNIDDKKEGSVPCGEDDECKWPTLISTSVLVFFFNYFCRTLWVCQCAQGGNNKVRCLAEKTGSLIVVSIGAAAIFAVIIMATTLNLGKEVFATFMITTGLSWVKGFFISCFMFWCRVYPKEKRAAQKAFDDDKKHFNSSVQELESRGVEFKTDRGYCFCLSVLTGLFFLRGDQNDYTVEASSGSATEMGAAGRNVVKKV